MSREIKRVPLDFDWPLHTRWPGYCLYVECGVCEGYGEDRCEWCRMDVDTTVEPNSGDGWQLWETLSEGSPISPVFATREELAWWMDGNHCTVGGPVPYESALRFIDAGWAPSMVVTPEQGVISGVEWVANSEATS